MLEVFSEDVARDNLAVALLVPDDLRTALRTKPSAKQFFGASAPSYRRNVLRWIDQAKRPDTRIRRIAATIEAAACGSRLPKM